MRFRDGHHAAKLTDFGIRPDLVDRKLREFWRELARLITLFDEYSPADLLEGEIGKFFFGKKRARQDSNLRPPA